MAHLLLIRSKMVIFNSFLYAYQRVKVDDFPMQSFNFLREFPIATLDARQSMPGFAEGDGIFF